MANSFYLTGANAFNLGAIDATSDTLKLALVSSAYTPNLTTDQFLNIISGGAIVAAGVALTSVTSSGATLSAANTVFTSVTGTAAAYLVLYKDTGTSSTSQLIALFDTATGLPVTPNGGNITVAWASGQVYTLFEGLAEREQDKNLRARIKEMMKQLWGWRRAESGLYLPAPSLVMG